MSASILSQFGIDTESVDQNVRSAGLAILRPPQSFTDLCKVARADYLAAFRSTRMQPPKKPFAPADLADGPWRKLTIGSKNGVGEAYAQLLQTIYFGPNQPGCTSLSVLFRIIIELRNRLMGVALDFGDDPVTDGFWNARRIHHYPSGGGFMMIHRDTYFPVKLGDLPFYQVMVPLSIKGLDFSEGGGMLVTKQGEPLNTDEIAGLGSIVIFDGKIQHGVEDVDPQEVMDFASERGRLAAFANLYVNLK